MFPIEPYSAEYKTHHQQPDGSMKREWRACRVLGITMDGDEPKYLIEVYKDGEQWLQVEPTLRTQPTQPRRPSA